MGWVMGGAACKLRRRDRVCGMCPCREVSHCTNSQQRVSLKNPQEDRSEQRNVKTRKRRKGKRKEGKSKGEKREEEGAWSEQRLSCTPLGCPATVGWAACQSRTIADDFSSAEFCVRMPVRLRS